MKTIYTIAENISSPLGLTSADNFSNLQKNQSGIRLHQEPGISPVPFHASLFNGNRPAFVSDPRFESFSFFERLLIGSIEEALKHTAIDPSKSDTIFIISSTKGNISLIEDSTNDAATSDSVSLHQSAASVADFFGNTNQPLVICNACISGVLALVTAKRLLNAGLYSHAIVAGADTITRFILSGFQSFQAVSPEPCRPFDVNRQGVSLGEGAATMILSTDPSLGAAPIRVLGGAITNDANHISGPSRTGEPLNLAIRRSLKESGISAKDIGLVVAHGTATIYNDEMEARALTLAGLAETPVNSLKGYYGHTLGAAGLIESAIAAESLRENILIPTKGFEELGVSKQINVFTALDSAPVDYVLKTASGFGGCNAAIIFGN